MRDEHNFWTRRTLSRRAALRGAGLGVAGVAGAALIGCGDDDDDDEAAVPAATQTPAAAATQAPAATAAAQADPGNWGGVKRGGTFVLTQPQDPPSLDPYQLLTYLAQRQGAFMYGRLLKYTTGPGIVPLSGTTGDLAESFEVSDDGLRWIFNLRPGVKFHNKPPLNGRELDAEDVTTSYDRFRAESPNSDSLKIVESIEAPDDRTIVFNLEIPFAPFEELMASPNVLWVFSKEANARDIDPEQPEGVIGTGPWMLGEMRPSVHITYDANPDYYVSVQTPSGPERLPLLDHFQYLIISEYAQIMSQFVAGAIHQFVPRNADIKSVQGQVKDVQTISRRPGWLGVWHSMNKESNDGLFNDVRVRRAYSMALDRDGLIEAFGELSKLRSEGIEIESGWTTVNVPWGDGGMFWWLDPKGPDFGEHARWYQYDPAESKKLLDAAGYTGDTVDFNFVTARYGTTYDQFTEAQIPMLRDAGFTVEPKSWEYRRVIGTEEGRNLPGVFYNYGTPYTTVDEYVFNQYVSESERVSMVKRYVTPELVDLVNKQRVEFDREARQAMIHDIQRLGSELMSAVPSVHTRFGGVDLQQPEVRNYAEFQTAGYGDPVEERMYYWFDA